MDSSPSNSQKTVSDDEEIDYSVKPEFYDPDLDAKDEIWVQEKRRKGSSDALLSCPACFTTLCFQCQRHDQFVTQDRAIFVVNCAIKPKPTNPVLLLRQHANDRPPKRKHAMMDSVVDNQVVFGGANNHSSIQEEEILHAVCCEVCSTEVGIMDEDEVYHFFNVLPSEA